MNPRMKKMLIGVCILFGIIIIWKTFSYLMMGYFMSKRSHAVTVSAMKVTQLPWQPKLKATGSLRAIKGVNVTTELSGMVQKILFTPGSLTKEGTLLVQLNADAEIGQLQSLQAQQKLAQITYKRDKAQYAIHAISKQTLENDYENLQSLIGQVTQQQAIVAKKSIRAPFSGRLGINQVNPGQYLNTGDKIVSLQTLDPIYADFYLPQQTLAKIQIGQTVVLTSDTFVGKIFKGKVTSIDSAVNNTTRNIEVEATIANPKYELTPGMFAAIEVDIGNPKKYLTLPQTAISYNSYGNIVYIVQKKDDKLTAKQVFVVTGETRGDQITVLKGLSENDTVVTSGQLKLKNGTEVNINNSVSPSDNPSPQVGDER